MNEISILNNIDLDPISNAVKSLYFNEHVIIITNLKQQYNLPVIIFIDDHPFQLHYCSYIYNEISLEVSPQLNVTSFYLCLIQPRVTLFSP